MKNILLLISTALLCVAVSSCKKNSTRGAVVPLTSFTFYSGDSLINYPIVQAAIQDVYTTHTTLITGEYTDTSAQKGNISIRLVGDTTGRYRGDSLFVTYTNALGKVYSKANDTTSFVLVDKFIKSSNGMVSGSFSLKVFSGSDSLSITQGTFSALYQE